MESFSRIQHRRDTTANWELNNPILPDGELGIEFRIDGTIGLKTGNGVDTWNDLPYLSGEGITPETLIALNDLAGTGRTTETIKGIYDLFNIHLIETITGLVNVKSYGAKGDGVTDDLNALIEARDDALINNKTFYIPEDFNCYISGDLDLSGIKNVEIRGIITGPSLTNILTLGYNSVTAKPTNYYINEVNDLKIKIHGIRNANVIVNFSEYFLIYADGNNDTKYAVDYSKFYLGNIDTLEFSSVAGAQPAHINENKFFGGRIHNLIIGGSYPHNNNIFYGPMFENFTANITDGSSSNYFYDCRLEGTIDITFGAETSNNYFFRSHFPLWHTYLKNLDTYDMTITNNGYDNGVIAIPDIAHKKECIFELNIKSKNFDTDDFVRNQYNIEAGGSYRTFFDSGIIPLTNPLSLVLISDQNLFEIFLYAYDVDKNLLTTEQTGFTSLPAFDNVNYRYNHDALKGTFNTGVPIIPTSIVKYFRYEVRTGAVIGQTFDYAKIIQIQQNNHWTQIIPVSKKYNYTKNGPTRPTKGYWYKGDYVENTNKEKLDIDSTTQYVVKGWIRLRDGTTYVNNVDWVEDRAYYSNKIDENGPTTSRPSTPVTGQRYFDTTLNKPIWYNGTAWVEATGATV